MAQVRDDYRQNLFSLSRYTPEITELPKSPSLTLLISVLGSIKVAMGNRLSERTWSVTTLGNFTVFFWGQ